MADYENRDADIQKKNFIKKKPKLVKPQKPQKPPKLPKKPRKPKQPSEKKRIIWWIRPILYILLVLLLSTLLAESGWLLASDFCAFNRGEIEENTVTVSADDDIRTVADKLYKAGLIKYRWFFRTFAAFAHAEEKIGAGTYALNTEMDYRALIVGMHSSSGNMKTATVRVTIPEGYSLLDIAELFEEKGVASKEEVLEAAANANFDYPFIDKNSHEASRLEGYLFPDTYEFYQPEKASSALNRLLINFEQKLDAWENEISYAETRGYNLKDIITIASLIEKETDGSDQARIASVIYNRMEGSGDRHGTYGLLQIDASLLYAMPDHEGAITSADLEFNSPYNLYIHEGLPPTPISNPGAQSILGALTPADTDYYYYALAKDRKHRFFSTYREFTSFLASSESFKN